MENAECLLKNDLEINVLGKDRESRTGQKEVELQCTVCSEYVADPWELWSQNGPSDLSQLAPR